MKKASYKLITAMCFIGAVTACDMTAQHMPKTWNWGARPRPLTGVANFPSADTDYGKGFKDGCSAGWDAVSKGLLSEFTGKEIDPSKLGTSSDYSTGWFDGLEQCTYILDWDVT